METKKAAAISALQEVIASCDFILKTLSDSPLDGQSFSEMSQSAEEHVYYSNAADKACNNLLELDMKAEAIGLEEEGKDLFPNLGNGVTAFTQEVCQLMNEMSCKQSLAPFLNLRLILKRQKKPITH